MNIILSLIVLASLVAFAAAMLLLCWLGAGESDVNGDPERDSGLSEIEIHARSWDHGSRATESRPNLEYARRMNREALRNSRR